MAANNEQFKRIAAWIQNNDFNAGDSTVSTRSSSHLGTATVVTSVSRQRWRGAVPIPPESTAPPVHPEPSYVGLDNLRKDWAEADEESNVAAPDNGVEEKMRAERWVAEKKVLEKKNAAKMMREKKKAERLMSKKLVGENESRVSDSLDSINFLVDELKDPVKMAERCAILARTKPAPLYTKRSLSEPRQLTAGHELGDVEINRVRDKIVDDLFIAYLHEHPHEYADVLSELDKDSQARSYTSESEQPTASGKRSRPRARTGTSLAVMRARREFIKKMRQELEIHEPPPPVDLEPDEEEFTLFEQICEVLCRSTLISTLVYITNFCRNKIFNRSSWF